jgi:chaperone modulatory protein CbpM
MFDTREFLLHARLDAESLDAWIAAGWLVPGRERGVRRFAEIDVARAQLIHDLKGDLGVNDEGIDVILDLLDQVHGLRRALRGLMTSIHAQPAELQQRIVAELRLAASARGGEEELPSGKVGGRDPP